MDDGLTRGVICFNCGTKMIPRMIVCLRSLRKHYQGNITLFLEGLHDAQLVKDLEKRFNLNIVYREVSPSTHKALVRKTEICQDSPYDISMFLDTDTIVLGDFSEMFEAAKDHDLAIPHFAGWSSSGGTISGRIKRYAPYKPDYIQAAINYGPAINTGIFAWPKHTPIFKEWLDIASWGEGKMFIADEVACQLILPKYNVKVLGTRCNVSVLHDPNTPDPRIVHFHGKKHCIEAPKCRIWISEFIEALKDNDCNIRKYALDGCGDKRLRRFIHENRSNVHADLQKEVRKYLGVETKSTFNGFLDNEVTIVTACDKKYIEHLKTTLPNWIKHKHLDNFPMIVYVNGFRRVRRNSELDFLRAYPNIRIIDWNLPKYDSQRELMLSAFVLGAARDVKTKYWVKVDADAFATNDDPLLTPEMKDYVICGHKWGYSFAKHIRPLVEWANSRPEFKDTAPDVFDESKVNGRRYEHQRVASYVQFHNSEFVRMAAKMVGDRLPIPSHDTYLWYVANRLGLPIMRHNFKRHRGMSNKSDLLALQGIVKGIDPEVGTLQQQYIEEDADGDESQD